MTKKKKKHPSLPRLSVDDMIGRVTPSGGKIVEKVKRFKNSETGEEGNVYVIEYPNGDRINEFGIYYKDHVPWIYRAEENAEPLITGEEKGKKKKRVHTFYRDHWRYGEMYRARFPGDDDDADDDPPATPASSP